VPSAFSGGYGLKGSIARLPHGGLSGLSAGMEAIIGCVGPMANSLEDLRLFCKVALDYEPWRYEPSLTPMPWKPTRAANLPKKLKIGVMWDDGMVQPHPPVTMALRQAVDLLKKDGHEIVNWDSKNCKETFAWINRAYFLDGADEYREILNPATDPPTKYMQYMFDNIATKRYTLEESWKINAEHDKVRMMYAEQLRQTGVDAMICPVAPTVAAAHEETLHWAYSAMWNALDLPGVVLPMGKVEEWHTWEECGIEKRLARSDMEAFYQECYKNGPSKYRDAPTSVQLIGERLQEEKLLAIAEVLDSLSQVEKARTAPSSESAKTTNIVVSSKMPVESVVEVSPLQQLVVRS
jgi:amidase